MIVSAFYALVQRRCACFCAFLLASGCLFPPSPEARERRRALRSRTASPPFLRQNSMAICADCRWHSHRPRRRESIVRCFADRHHRSCLRARFAPLGPQQQGGPLAPMPSPILTFAGISFNDSCTGGQCGGGWPPDPNGDVGPNHYIEAVNTSYAIYNKSGTRLAAFTEDQLWSGAPASPCTIRSARRSDRRLRLAGRSLRSDPFRFRSGQRPVLSVHRRLEDQ